MKYKNLCMILKSGMIIFLILIILPSNLFSQEHKADIEHSRDINEINYKQPLIMMDFLRKLSLGFLDTECAEAVMNEKGTHLIIGQFNLARKLEANQYRQLLMGLDKDEMPKIAPVDSSERAAMGVEGLKQVWMILKWGIENVKLIEDQFNRIKKIEVFEKAKKIAELNLPVPLKETPEIYFVMGGRVGAAAIGNEVYYDILSMVASSARRGETPPQEKEIISFFGHEMHHVGYKQIRKEIMSSYHFDDDELYALGVLSGLISEGSATYLISNNRDIESMRNHRRYKDNFAKDKEILKLCETIISKALNKEIVSSEEYDKAASGLLGSALHVSGSILLSVIDKAFGKETIMKIILDPRLLLSIYNDAVKELSNDPDDNSFYVFDSEIAEKVITMGE